MITYPSRCSNIETCCGYSWLVNCANTLMTYLIHYNTQIDGFEFRSFVSSILKPIGYMECARRFAFLHSPNLYIHMYDSHRAQPLTSLFLPMNNNFDLNTVKITKNLYLSFHKWIITTKPFDSIIFEIYTSSSFKLFSNCPLGKCA